LQTDELDARLAALEARAPVAGLPPSPSDVRSLRRLFGSPGLVAAGLTLVLGATAVAGGAVLEAVRSHEGVENRGQPLHGADMECMSPPEAEAFLTGKGFMNVVWQVESGTGKDGRSVHQTKAPEHGYVVPGAIIDGTLHMVVDQREDATGTGACFRMKMP
jgi:hypothetical protein